MVIPIRPLSPSLRKRSSGRFRQWSSRVTSGMVCLVRYSALCSLNTMQQLWKRFVLVV
ncbi:gene 19.3 protein [Enterobacteria phage T3]|uniref:Uncharacterized protein n=3 Tax=Teetrevirus TaxID=2732693 RepID=T1PV58_9CAUD|nr:DUF5466 domain-containing protein [Enterobacteria phage T3]YP_009793122.1 DUF5466 domain-containing protein [Enterobacteria phage T7M]AEM44624.1 gp 19.3 [Enterobacteria phage 3/7]AFQ97083.1 hypothetical protein [Enterobacteria phage T7M]CAC86312.1 gene 19.3 protein [Enterobacteria phage T3]